MLPTLYMFKGLEVNIVVYPILIDQIKITELPEFAQLAFEGYKTLNRIQSRIFPTAYNSNENLLVSTLDPRTYLLI
jgi:hypothetical protein